MSHIFISYSRKDIDFAQRIVDALAANNLDTWIDWKSIPKGEDWEQEIYRGIEEADAFLFLISPDSVASEMCNKEITHAVTNGKRILPIVIQDADKKNFLFDLAREEISKRNWIFCREGQDDFNKAIEETRRTIHTDYDWLKFHTELQVKALKWNMKRDSSRLLRGKELREAEQRLADAGNLIAPQPTDLQRQFLLNSQRNELRVRRQIIMGLISGLIITAVLAFIALAQRSLAVEQARIARSGELAALALSDMNGNFDRALLFGVESFKLEPNSRSLNSMSSLLQSRPEVAKYLVGQSSFITSLAVSPDGRILASGSCGKWVSNVEITCDQGEIILWDTSSPSGTVQIAKLSGHDMGVSSLAFTPDGKYLASADWDGTITLWDFNDPHAPKIRTELRRNPVPVFSIAISPNGKMLASAGGNIISLWDITEPATPVKLASMVDQENSFTLIESIAFSASSTLLASAGETGIILLWDLTSPTSPYQLATMNGHAASVNSVTFGSDDQILASGSDDQTIILWDVSKPSAPRLEKQFEAHKGSVDSLAFSPDNKILASGGEDNKLILWDVSDPYSPWKMEELLGHSNGITDIIFGPNRSFIASGDFLGRIILWKREVETVPMHFALVGEGTGEVGSVAYRPDGRIFASGENQTLHLWDVSNSGKPVELSSMNHSGGEITSMAFNPDGNMLAIGDSGFLVTLWDVSNPDKPVKNLTLSGHQNVVRSVVFNMDGNILISSGGADVIFWDTSNPDNPIQLAAIPGYDSSLALSLDGRLLAVGNYLTRGITLWDVANISNPKRLSYADEYAAALAFSPDNSILITGSCGSSTDLISCTQGEITTWDISETSQLMQIATLRVHSSKITGLSFSPNGGSFASASADGIMVWDISALEKPEQKFKLTAMLENVISFSYSPDGKSLVSGTADGKLTLWNLDPALWIKVACQISGRNFTPAEWIRYFPGEEYRLTCPQWPAGD